MPCIEEAKILIFNFSLCFFFALSSGLSLICGSKVGSEKAVKILTSLRTQPEPVFAEESEEDEEAEKEPEWKKRKI